MFRDLVVPITGTSGDTDALDVAIDLATSLDAHLMVLEMVHLPVPMNGPWGLLPDVVMADIHATLRRRAANNVAALRLRLDRETIAAEVRAIECMSGSQQSAASCARCADLVVVAGSTGNPADAAATHDDFSNLLFESGRPVLVVPPHCNVAMPPHRIVVAWSPSREATRALHDAMPLLLKAQAVDIAIVDPGGGERGHGDQPGADIATHLARHGVKANVDVLDAQGEPIGSVLLDHACRMGADLLVSGGYGHSRVREWALGGVTRELLTFAPIPVFYSH